MKVTRQFTLVLFLKVNFLHAMVNTKQTGKKSAGGKAPRKQLAWKADLQTATAKAKVRPHIYRPGTAALRKIRKWQKYSAVMIRNLPFQRVVREIVKDHKSVVRYQASAITALQHTAEDMLPPLFEEARRAAIHSKRVTVMLKEIKLATRMVCEAQEFLSALVKNELMRHSPFGASCSRKRWTQPIGCSYAE